MSAFSGGLWGGTKFNCDVQSDDKPLLSAVGGTLGVLVQTNKSGLSTIRFFVNGVKCGPGFADVQGPLIPAVQLLAPAQAATLLPDAQWPM